jgi:Domain of unknown function (DUF4440)
MEDSREAAVRAATQRWLDATVRADVATLDELLEKDYTFTHATTAATDTREEWLESFRSGRRRYKSWSISDVSISLYPGVAVMVGRGHQEVVRADGLFDLKTSFMNTWIDHDGKWRLAGWQATLVPHA